MNGERIRSILAMVTLLTCVIIYIQMESNAKNIQRHEAFIVRDICAALKF